MKGMKKYGYETKEIHMYYLYYDLINNVIYCLWRSDEANKSS